MRRHYARSIVVGDAVPLTLRGLLRTQIISAFVGEETVKHLGKPERRKGLLF